ncbi:hypothetical protein A3770_01p08350 [Chloropicon primus]|uniref:Protein DETOXIFICATION n=1 Tax=Chloropicon primus TaxID=1764295 RepID=A0A5B8MD36_9CHLO|nr:hypothetical protein A3770_01p08350 [Chloropicon primus]|eukprot:QDZ18317.1 hypothetical protein A3770_01p08350 [Chloropicon primus]
MKGKGKESVIDDIFASAKKEKQKKEEAEKEKEKEKKEAEEKRKRENQGTDPSSSSSSSQQKKKQKKKGREGGDRKGEAFVAAVFSKDKDDFDLDSLLPRYKRKKTNEGFAIYSERELRINQGGGTDFRQRHREGIRDVEVGRRSRLRAEEPGGDARPAASSWLEDVGAILRFALPALGSSLASPILSAVDTAVVGRCATTVELAALGPSSTVFDSLGLIFAFLQVASINKLAGLAKDGPGGDGEEWKARRRAAAAEFGMLSVLVGLVLMSSLVFGAGWLMSATTSQASAEAIKPAALYTRIRAIAVPAFIAQITMQGILMGLSKDSVTPLLAVLISGMVNTVGDVLLVGWLRTGIVGAAIATVVAQFLAATFLFSRIVKELRPDGGSGGEPFRLSLPPLSTLPPLLRESAPFLVMKVLTCVKVFLMNYLSTMFGSAALAAHLVALTIWRVLILVGEPLSYAAQSFAPQYFRSEGSGGREEAARGLYYVKLVLGIGLALSALMFVATRLSYLPLSSLFTQDLVIRERTRSVLNQVTLSVCVFPILLSLEGSLLAIGRVKDLVKAMALNVLFIVCGGYLVQDSSLQWVWWVFCGMHTFYAATMSFILYKKT